MVRFAWDWQHFCVLSWPLAQPWSLVSKQTLRFTRHFLPAHRRWFDREPFAKACPGRLSLLPGDTLMLSALAAAPDIPSRRGSIQPLKASLRRATIQPSIGLDTIVTAATGPTGPIMAGFIPVALLSTRSSTLRFHIR